MGWEWEEAARDLTIARYRAALDAGDMQGVVQVLDEALDDPELDRLISEANREVQIEIDREMYEEEARDYREASGALRPGTLPGAPSPEEEIRRIKDRESINPEDLVW